MFKKDEKRTSAGSNNPTRGCRPESKKNGKCKRTKSLRGPLIFLCLMLFLDNIGNNRAFGKSSLFPQSELDTTQRNTTQISLELGKPLDAEITGGSTQTYAIDAPAGSLVRISIEQRGVDVAETVRTPEGNLLAIFDSEMRAEQADRIDFVADKAGIYRVEVKAKIRDVIGRYEIRVVEIGSATERDRLLTEAHRLRTQSVVTFRSGKYDEAIALAERALKTGEEATSSDDAYVGDLLNQLGYMQREKGEYSKAEATLQRALTINEKGLGPEHPQTIYSVNCLGLVYLSRNEWPNAGRMLQRALDLSEKVLGANHPGVALLWFNIASLHSNLGDSQQAEKEFLHALSLAEKLLEPNDILRPMILNSLARLYINRKDYEKADGLEQEALSIFEKASGPEHPNVVAPLINLGIAARERKEYVKALQFYQRALRISEQTVGPEHINVAMLLNNIANIYKVRRDYQKALELQQRALSIGEKSGGPYHILTLISIGNLANLYRVLGDVDRAVAFQTNLDQRLETTLSLNLAIGSERQKLAYFDSLRERTDRTISLHLNFAPAEPRAAALAALVLLQRKGRVLDAMSASLTALRERFDADDQKLLDQLNSTTAQLAKLVLGGPQKVNEGEYESQLKALQERKERLEASISERSADFRTRLQPVTLASVGEAIPKDAALIEFASYRPFDPRIEGNQYGEPRYVAYILHSNLEVSWKELGAAKEIDTLVESFRKALGDPQRKDVQQLARSVDQRIMEPLRPLLGDSTHLLISPDGQLNLIPFAALVDEYGKYLVQRYTITYLTSGRDLLRTQVQRESRSQPLIVANPLFGDPTPVPTLAVMKPEAADARRRSVTSGRSLSEVYFAPLWGTALEAQTIRTIFPDATLLSGRQATETAIKKTRAPEILHIATHGFFLQDSIVTPEEVAGLRGISANVKIENPLMRSGLALADANVHSAGSDDGILTAFEASGLNLWGTKLVVLSACDTGVGEVRNGEGVYGLRRAFVLAGAESLVMSLWPVSDGSTRDLMTRYYQNLKKGIGRSESLRQVQLEMLKRDPKIHPFYWANFIESGDWANLDGKR